MKTLKSLKNVILFVLALIASAGTMAADGWKQSYEGGAYEFLTEKQDIRLLVTCNTADKGPQALSSVTLSRLSTGHRIGQFKIIVNGNTYDGPIETASRVGSENFKALMKDLRRGDANVKYAAYTVLMSKTGAAKAILPVDSKFPCQTLF